VELQQQGEKKQQGQPGKKSEQRPCISFSEAQKEDPEKQGKEDRPPPFPRCLVTDLVRHNLFCIALLFLPFPFLQELEEGEKRN